MSSSEKNIALVCNPTRENHKALQTADSIGLLLSGMDVRHKFFLIDWPKDFDDFTEVWIIGGDGTVHWFINKYPEIELPLAVFSGGAGNDFHWMLYGERTTEEQVEYVLAAVPQSIDAGICNGRLFLNGVGIGFDGAIVHDLLGKRKLAGKASYLVSILKQIVAYHEKPCTLQMPAMTFTQDCFMISVANGKRYGGGFQVAPKASLTDGLLDISVIGKISSFSRMKYLPVIEKGEHLNLPFVQYHKAERITITSPVKLHAHMDGEYLQEDVFEIQMLPKRFSFFY